MPCQCNELWQNKQCNGVSTTKGDNYHTILPQSFLTLLAVTTNWQHLQYGRYTISYIKRKENTDKSVN